MYVNYVCYHHQCIKLRFFAIVCPIQIRIRISFLKFGLSLMICFRIPLKSKLAIVIFQVGVCITARKKTSSTSLAMITSRKTVLGNYSLLRLRLNSSFNPRCVPMELRDDKDGAVRVHARFIHGLRSIELHSAAVTSLRLGS